MSPSSYQGRAADPTNKDQSRSQTRDSNLAQSGQGSRVSDILQLKGGVVLSVAPGDPVREAVTTLRINKIGVLIVMSDGKLRGILSERDVVKMLDLEGPEVLDLPCVKIMTPDPFTCSPSDEMLPILRRMTDGHYRHMPVLDDDRLVGLISIGDVVKMRLKDLEYEALQMKQMIVG